MRVVSFYCLRTVLSELIVKRVCLECNIPQRTETAVRCGRPRSVWPDLKHFIACDWTSYITLDYSNTQRPRTAYTHVQQLCNIRPCITSLLIWPVPHQTQIPPPAVRCKRTADEKQRITQARGVVTRNCWYHDPIIRFLVTECGGAEDQLTLWRRNFLLNFSTSCI